MSASQEVEEHVHHAMDPFDKVVAGLMAIIAALLAVVSVLGQYYNTEQLLMQGQASDQWAYYQAKDIRRFVAEATRDSLSANAKGAAQVQKYDTAAKKYRADADGIQKEAHRLEHERNRAGEKAHRFHYGEVFLEVAIVFSSLSILMKARALFLGGILAAVVGVGIAVTAWSI